MTAKSPTANFRWAFVAAGFATLIVSAYFDIIRSPLLPKVLRELHLEFGDAGWYFAAGHASATAATGLLVKGLNRWTERTLTLWVAGFCVAGGIGAHFVSAFASLIILASLMGGSIAALGALSNILVIEGTPGPHQSRILSGLHTMYGLGSMMAASVVSFAISRGAEWPLLYAAGLPLLAVLVVIAAFGMGGRRARPAPRIENARLNRLQILVVVLFAIYVVGEVTATMWLPSYLVKVTGMDEAAAAMALTRFFGVLTGARILCFLFIAPALEKPVLLFALIAPILAFILGFLWLPQFFPVMGFCGAFFPVFLARISRRFAAQWRSVTIWTMTAMNVLVGIAEITLGQLADRAGLRLAFLIPPAMWAATLVLLCIYFAKEELPA